MAAVAATYAALPTTASVCTHPAPPPAAPPAAKSAPDLGADNEAVRRRPIPKDAVYHADSAGDVAGR